MQSYHRNLKRARAPDISDGLFFDLFTRIAEERRHTELLLVQNVVADPVRLVGVAEAVGITDVDFQFIDLRLLWLCAKFATDQHHAFTICREALQHFHYWSDGLPAGTDGLWSEQRLRATFMAMPPDATVTATYASMLLDTNARQTRAQEHINHAIGLLTDWHYRDTEAAL